MCHIEAVQEKAVRAPSTANKPSRMFAPVVVVTVGLPARNKSQLATALTRRLNWNNISTKVMRVSDYRRKRLEPYASHELFRPDHEANVALRALAQKDAMHECASWLEAGNNVAILDSTLVSREQRDEVYKFFTQLNYRVLFIECVCEDSQVLESNYHEILRHSLDYANMDPVVAAEDLQMKIDHYQQIHEPMDETCYPRIRVNTATMEVCAHKVAGHVETTVLGYVASISFKPQTLYFSRHGESEFNVMGKIGGDAPLSCRGEQYAQALAAKINSMQIPNLQVLTSRLRRTVATAKNINAPKNSTSLINELYAGVCEGLTYEDMQKQYPREFAWRDLDKLRYRFPLGESYVDVMQRVEPIIGELQTSQSPILTVSHQAILRCIIGYFMDKKPEELPYMEVPLHTIIRISSQGFKNRIELIPLGIECVNTMRHKPQDCSDTRTADDALITVPAHYEIPNPWRGLGSTAPTLVQQH